MRIVRLLVMAETSFLAPGASIFLSSINTLRLNRCHSAIDDQFRAGDEAAGIRGEEDHRFGDLIGLAHASQRYLGGHLSGKLFDALRSEERRVGKECRSRW